MGIDNKDRDGAAYAFIYNTYGLNGQWRFASVVLEEWPLEAKAFALAICRLFFLFEACTASRRLCRDDRRIFPYLVCGGRGSLVPCMNGLGR